MAKRTKGEKIVPAHDLRNEEYAREFLIAAVEDGMPIQAALAKVIRATGVKEFGARAHIPGTSVLRAISPRYNPTRRTLNRLLAPFRLRLSLARIPDRKRRHA